MSLHLDGLLATGEDTAGRAVTTPCGVRSTDATTLRAQLSGRLDQFGITRVAHVTGLDRLGVPVHVAFKPQGRSLSSGSGKSTSVDGSWVSAVMEAAEQSVWEELATSDVKASAETMERFGCVVADCHRLPTFVRGRWNDQMPCRWRAGWDIVHGEEVWVPDEMVTMRRPSSSVFVGGSNGLASGATVLEATLSALLELIERDSLAHDDVSDQDRRVDFRPVAREVAPELVDVLSRSGVVLEVRDVTTEIGVPTVVAVLSDAPGEHVGVFLGAGAATSTSVALVRALTEAAQSRCVVVAGARDDIFRSDRRAAAEILTRRHGPDAGDPPALVPRNDTGLFGVLDRLEWVTSQLARVGIDRVVVLRHTAPSDVVQVVRVVVPGLEWSRYKSPTIREGRNARGEPAGVLR